MKIPNNLSIEAKNGWKELESCFELEEGLYIVLKVMFEAYDRLQQARREIKKRGLIIKHPKTGFERENPALKIEKEARSGFLQAWRQLGIDIDVKDVGRPTDDRRLEWEKKLSVLKGQ